MRIENEFNLRQINFSNKFNDENNTKVQNNDESFGDVLKECVDNVNNLSIQSNTATNAFVKGEDVSIDEVMLKASEASLGLQFLTTTRDKLVEGYKELIKMQV